MNPWGSSDGSQSGFLSRYFWMMSLAVPGAQPLKFPRGDSHFDLSINSGSGHELVAHSNGLGAMRVKSGRGKVVNMRL